MIFQRTRIEADRPPPRGAGATLWCIQASALFFVLGVFVQSAGAATAQDGVGGADLSQTFAADPSAGEGVGSDAGEPQIVQRRWSDRDGNPPGPRGGRGTNWENPPGPRGGPGTSPDRRIRPGDRGFRDRDGNPPGPRGGRGTNWENPPGPRGGPGASPDRRVRPGHRGFRDRDGNPPGPRGGRGTNWENPPGPRGGPGASPDRRMGRGAYRPRR